MARTSRKSRKMKRGTRRHRGGAKYDFSVTLFSGEPIDDELKNSLFSILQDKYSKVTMETLDEEKRMFKYLMFEGSTGITEDLQTDIVVYNCTNPPRYLFNEKMDLDGRLTKLEYEIRDMLLEKNVDISLIPAPHGLQPSDYVNAPDEYRQFHVGLCTPKCS